MNCYSCFGWFISWIPRSSKNIDRWGKKPALLPLIKSKIFNFEVCRHLCQKIFSSTIFPSILNKIIMNSFHEIILSHQKHQLLEYSRAFLISNRVKIHLCNSSVIYIWTNCMGCWSNLIFSVSWYSSY